MSEVDKKPVRTKRGKNILIAVLVVVVIASLTVNLLLLNNADSPRKELKKAVEYIEQGNYAAAAEILQDLADMDYKNAEELLEYVLSQMRMAESEAMPEPSDPVVQEVETVQPEAPAAIQITVRDAYSATYDDGYEEYQQRIPEVYANDVSLENVNSKIYSELEEYIGADSNYSINYSYYDDIEGYITIVAEGRYIYVEHTFYDIYTIDAANDRFVSEDELLALYDMDEETYRAKVRTGIENYYEKCNVPQDAQVYLEECRVNSLSSSNIEAAVPFIGQNGDLCVSVDIYWIAGADKYEHQINLRTGQEMGLLSDEELEQFYMSLDSRYINYGDLSEFDDYQLMIIRNSFFAMEGYVFKDEDLRYYFMNKSWYNPNPGLSADDAQNRMNDYQLENLSVVMEYEDRFQ